ncbi:bifunctional diguanylate cyclase/phosphodiesterase [Kineosporia sp. A_224]|uniref:putative bifunctional diguanylate cyclase/phosphodiesterase n=1 Tax=Kineosporia sp. A_224 TaxID=1962180 RepID=UPI00130472DF|nr:EAL domain-containing protein [Kineosporia sp. A_224]
MLVAGAGTLTDTDRLAMYETLLDDARSPLLVTTLPTAQVPWPPVVHVSPGLLARSGWDESDVLGSDPRLFHGPGTDAATAERLAASIAAGGGPTTEVLKLYQRDGTSIWVEVTVSPLTLGGGTFLVWVHRDVTRRRLVEAERRDREAFVRSVLASLPSQTAVVDGEGVITAVNDAWIRYWRVHPAHDFPPEEATPPGQDPTVGMHYLDVCAGAYATPSGAAGPAAAIAAGLADVLEQRRPAFTTDFALAERHSMRWFQVQIVPLRGRPGAVVSHQDITERKLGEQVLAFEATHDPLTALANRFALRDLLDGLLPPRPGSPAPALLFADLDGFKAVNDGLGHGAGDEVLIEVTRRLVRVADDATIARLGGDEFALLLPEADEASASDLAVRVVEVLREPYDVAGLRLTVSASVGVAVADGTHRTPGDLLRDADAAMYQAKERGRDRYAVFGPQLRERAVRRVRILDRLRHAMSEPTPDGLTLHYQPIVSFADRRLVGLEALARWRDDRLGVVPPGEFIEVAEDSGLIVRLGMWALVQACTDAVAAPGDLTVSVNVSPRQLADARIVDVVEEALALTGLPPHRLCLEITEGAVMSDIDAAVVRLGTLRAQGVRIALDDFGTGWSSLGHLQRLPVDRLKVDRSFVEALRGETEPLLPGPGRGAPWDRDAPARDRDGAAAVVSAIVALARGLGMRVTAEGVETAEQFRYLRELGCDDAQGFHLGRPAPWGAPQVVLPDTGDPVVS